VVSRQIVPDETSPGGVDVGFPEFQREFVGDCAAVIVGVLFAAISDLPGLLVVIAGDGGVRPVMAVTRNFAAVVEVVQHAEF